MSTNNSGNIGDPPEVLPYHNGSIPSNRSRTEDPIVITTPKSYSPEDMILLGKAFMLVFKERNDSVEAKIKTLSDPSYASGLLLSQWKSRIPSQDYPKMLDNLQSENKILTDALTVIQRYDKPISIGGYRRRIRRTRKSRK